MEPSVLMKQYPKFDDYLKTQMTYIQIRDNLDVNPITSSNLAKFVLNLPVAEKKEIGDIVYPEGWEEIFTECKDEIKSAIAYVNSQIKIGKQVFPKEENIFRAFKLINPKQIKVIIVGQDPYHSRDRTTGEPVANGLAFSCNGSQIQSSLLNIYKEIENTFGRRPSSGNLEHLCSQGVFLINKCLTVNDGEAKSHGSAWNFVIHKILNMVLAQVDFCFLCLWGRVAQSLVEGRDKLTFNSQRIMVLNSYHPSGFNTGEKSFVGCGHFKTINQLLIQNGHAGIDWVGP